MKTLELTDRLKNRGFRITKQRLSILEALMEANKPLTPKEIIFKVRKVTSADKATIYRNLEFLLQNRIIKEVYFNDNYIRYELAQKKHHHHIVCKGCSKIIAVELRGVEELILKTEIKIQRKLRFKKIDHSIEFFGYCKNCANLVSKR